MFYHDTIYQSNSLHLSLHLSIYQISPLIYLKLLFYLISGYKLIYIQLLSYSACYLHLSNIYLAIPELDEYTQSLSLPPSPQERSLIGD